MKLLKSWIVYFFVFLSMNGCGEPVPIACTPDEEECATEREGGFETGPVAGIAAGGAVVLALAGGASGGEDSNSANANSSNEVSDPSLSEGLSSLLQGYVSQTRVVGARVWIDRNLNNKRDPSETDTITSNNGLFSINLSPLDEVTNYRLISTGGSARALSSTAATVGVMLAPRGAKNITPLTTVVALNNNLASSIAAATGESYDVDIAKSGGVSPKTLRLAKGIETFMHVFARSESNLLTSVEDQVRALTYLADRLSVANLVDSTSIENAVKTAVSDTISGITSLSSLTTASKSSLKNDVASTSKKAMDAITSTASTITEESILSAVSNAVSETSWIVKDSFNKQCNFAGGTVPDGGTVIAYQTAVVPASQSCSSETRLCLNGQLSGSYSFSACEVEEIKSCQFNGSSISNGVSVSAYQTSVVPFGSTCTSQLRTCSDGILSGSYVFSNCNEAEPIACAFGGTTVNHGTWITAYLSTSVPSGSSCTSQVRTCFNGVLSGSYTNGICEVQTTSVLNQTPSNITGGTTQFGASKIALNTLYRQTALEDYYYYFNASPDVTYKFMFSAAGGIRYSIRDGIAGSIVSSGSYTSSKSVTITNKSGEILILLGPGYGDTPVDFFVEGASESQYSSNIISQPYLTASGGTTQFGASKIALNTLYRQTALEDYYYYFNASPDVTYKFMFSAAGGIRYSIRDGIAGSIVSSGSYTSSKSVTITNKSGEILILLGPGYGDTPVDFFVE